MGVDERALFASLAFVLGLAIGSFLNVVIHRLPRMLEAGWRRQCEEIAGHEVENSSVYNLAKPASACPTCGHAITVLENIPVLSWLWLGGRCSACKTAISPRYPIVELLTALLSVACVLNFGYGLMGLGALLLVWFLIALAFIDLDTGYLFDDLTLPLLWCGLLFNLFGVFTNLQSAVIGAMAGYLSLWSVYWLFRLATGKEGMGFGDFKLLAAIGAWLGWQLLPVTLLLSSLVGAIVGVAMILFARRDRHAPIPFGPYLAGGALVAMFFGPDLMRAWLDMLQT